MIDGYTLPLALRKTPMGLRVRWALEATFVYLAQQQKAVESKEFLTILSEILAYWQIPQEYAEKFMKLTKQPPRKDFDPLTAYGKLLVPIIKFGPERQSLAVSKVAPLLSPEERPFRILTQEGDKYVTDLEYKKKYANVPNPHSKEPLVWVNLKTGTFSLWVGKKCRRREPIITGEKRILFCMLLRNFNKCIPVKDLAKVQENHPQILNQLHDATFGMLRPFVEIHKGESRILKPYSKYNHKRMFTFCLIEPDEVSDDDK